MNAQQIRLKAVALPAEHGGWALVLEPIVLGFLLAPSLPGLCIALASFACFLTRQPLKLALGDRRKGSMLARTVWAQRFAILYATAAAGLFALSLLSEQKSFLIPILIAAPFMLVQLAYDAFGHGRRLLPELSGAIGAGAIATAITLAGGWPRLSAFILWGLVAGRHVPTILYLRTRLKLRRGAESTAAKSVVILAQLIALIAVGLLAWRHLVPALAVVAFVILAVRAVMGLISLNSSVTPKKLGIAEFAFGALTVLAITVGYALGW